MQNCSKSIESYWLNTKSSSVSGGVAPLTPTGGFALYPRWGLRPRTPL